MTHPVFHESSPDIVADHAIGAYGFRYLLEPFSFWLTIKDQNVDPNNYTQVKLLLFIFFN